MTAPERMLRSGEAARRLGVRRQTLYAYVSRGLLTRHVGDDRRASLYDAAEIDRLADRARRGGRSGALELAIDSELTLMDPDGTLCYRGLDAVELSRARSFEQVAALLWGEEPCVDWFVDPASAARGRAAVAALGSRATLAERMRIILAALPVDDPLRGDLRPAAVRSRGRMIVAGLIDCLEERSLPREDTIAARLWSRLAERRPLPGQLAFLDAALVLLADHELSASTLAARVAASAHADPYLVVQAGMSALGGTLHGAVSSAIEDLLAQIAEPEDVEPALQRLHAAERPIPGFGHAIYRARDPRADELLERLGRASPAPDRRAVAERVVEAVGRLDGPQPNVDFAVAAASDALGMVTGAPQAVFAVARTAGWIAHALEEYPHALRLRGRAVYVGPRPPGTADG